MDTTNTKGGVAARGLDQVGYEAYGEAAGWKTFDGRPMPTWEELGHLDHGGETKRRWLMAAEAIVRMALEDEARVTQPLNRVPR